MATSRPRIVANTLAIVGSVLLVAALILVVGQLFFTTQSIAWVNGVSHDDTFTLELDHRRVYTDGDEYVLSVRMSWDDLASVLEQQHPDGTIAPDGSWQLMSATTPVVVRPADDTSNEFIITAQVAHLSTDADVDNPPRFAFPASATGLDHLTVGTTVRTDVGDDELRRFYSALEGAEVSDDSISVPSSTGTTVVLDLSGDGVMASVAMSPAIAEI